MKRLAILITVFVLVSCHPTKGFLESEFALSPESRLPVWFSQLPEDTEREDVTVLLRYYTSPFDVDDTVLILKKGSRTLERVTGRSEHHPKYWAWAREDWPNRSHPSYVNITIEGKTEIIEHKKMEPVFYVSSEEAVKSTLGTEY